MMVQERDLFFNINLIYNKTLKGLYKQWSAQLFCLISASSKCKKMQSSESCFKSVLFSLHLPLQH